MIDISMLLLSMFFYTNCYSQSYFYFETTISTTSNKPLSYYIFLTTDADGTAAGRILFKDPATGENKLVKQNFIDSSATTANDTTGDKQKYLVPFGNAYHADDTVDPTFIKPRFVFLKQVANNEIFYVPSGIEYTFDKVKWQPAVLTVNQQKSYPELAGQKDLVSLFYSREDSFYKYLFDIDTRGLNNIDKKTKLYLITVANTNDPKIGITSQKDFGKITATFKQMAAGLGISILSKEISAIGFNKKAVNDAIDTWLKPTPLDIVVLYYSGHGFRYSNDASKYPRMSLRTGPQQDLDLNNMGIEEAYNRILKKGARVNIVLGDCCNEDIGAPVPVGKLPLKTRDPGTEGLKLNIDNCKALFFPNHPLSILACAAEVGQLATGNPELGGFFTNFLQLQLVKSLYGNEGESSWLRILLNAKEGTRRQALTALCGDGRCVQRAEISVIPLQ